MKKNYKFFKTIFIGIIACVSLSIMFAGCNKDDDAVNNTTTNSTTDNTPIFAMEFSYSGRNVSTEYLEIDVFFTTTDISVIPEVEVNGVVVEKFEFEEGISGQMEIPFSEVINYKVTANGKTTSGSITMPIHISSIDCNGLTIPYNNAPDIPEVDTYDYSWQPSTCDYQRISYLSYSRILDNDIATHTMNGDLLSENMSYCWFNVYFKNGDRIIPGATPSVSGEYGNGYVIASVYNNFSYDITIGKSKKTASKIVVTPEVRLKEFVRNFNEVCVKK